MRPPVIDGIEELDFLDELDRRTEYEIRRPRGSCSSPVEGLCQIRLRNAARSRATLSATTRPILWGLHGILAKTLVAGQPAGGS